MYVADIRDIIRAIIKAVIRTSYKSCYKGCYKGYYKSVLGCWSLADALRPRILDKLINDDRPRAGIKIDITQSLVGRLTEL